MDTHPFVITASLVPGVLVGS